MTSNEKLVLDLNYECACFSYVDYRNGYNLASDARKMVNKGYMYEEDGLVTLTKKALEELNRRDIFY